LLLLKRYYHIAYLSGPDSVPLEAGSEERVVKLKLLWKSPKENFKSLIVSFSLNGLIRRVESVTKSAVNIQYDFENIVINSGISTSEFRFTIPANANIVKNFLYKPEG